MLPYAAFHQGHHCLPKYLLTGLQNERVKIKKSDFVFFFFKKAYLTAVNHFSGHSRQM